MELCLSKELTTGPKEVDHQGLPGAKSAESLRENPPNAVNAGEFSRISVQPSD